MVRVRVIETVGRRVGMEEVEGRMVGHRDGFEVLGVDVARNVGGLVGGLYLRETSLPLRLNSHHP